MGKRHTRRRRRGAQATINMQVKNALLIDVSHEVRTPLSAVVGYSEMLLEEAMECGYQTLLPDLHKLHAASSRVLALLNDITTLATAEAGSLEVCYEVFAMHCLIDPVVAQSQTLLGEHNNLLEIDIAADITLIYNDFIKLKACLQHILAHACMLTEHGTITLCVWQETHAETAWLVFEICDTGVGLSQAQTGDVLYDVMHTNAVTARQYSGTGLGLAVSRRFCQMLGGELTLTSTVGSGTIYTMRLPIIGPEPAATRHAGGPEYAA